MSTRSASPYRILLILLGLSVLLHWLILVVLHLQDWLLNIRDKKPDEQTVSFQLVPTPSEQKKPEPSKPVPPKPKPPEPKPPEPEVVKPKPVPEQEHMPRHNADKTDLRGSETGKIDGKADATKKKSKKEKAKQESRKTEQILSDKPTTKATETNTTDAKADDAEREGQSDATESDNIRLIRMANLYLKRMKEQVLVNFHSPSNSTLDQKGEIWLSIDANGYLERSVIGKSSGNMLLDLAALEAIRAVPRYEVPDDKRIVEQFYSKLVYSYRGGGPMNRPSPRQ